MLRRFAPLRIKLPTMVALLLAVCTGAVVIIAYRAVRSSVSTAAASQLQSAAVRLSTLVAPSARRSNAEAQRIGGIPPIHSWLIGGAGSDAARAALDSVRKATAQTSAITLIRGDGRRLATTGANPATATSVPNGLGQFFANGDTVGYAFAAPLLSGTDTVGRFVTVKSASGGSGTIDQLGGFVGQHVTMLLGNADGSVWTDLARPMPSPASVETVTQALRRGNVATGSVIAGVARVPNTPWIVWIAQPAGIALEPATTLVRRLALIAVLVVLIGAAVAWAWVRRVIAPLDEAAEASEAVARGDYRRRITTRVENDELGRLAAAFNSMATTIEAHHAELERLVAERTAALETAMGDLRHAQDEVVRNARLATLGQLAGGVGHELRNPLGVMTNAVYVLETVLANPDPMVRDYFGILKTQIALSEKIVADLLDFARTKPAARAPTAIDALVRQQVSRLGPLGKARVEEDFPAALPAADVDAVQIGQVVLNLVANATQALGERGGVITCRAHYDGNGTIALDVADTGPGMPDDVAKRIFEPLFTTKARGLGLGLAVSRMLTENNGGRLTFTTKVGEGTTFTLTLPAAHG